MKRTFVSLLIIFTLAGAATAQEATSQDYRFALGVRLSNASPTLNNSITGKFFITQTSAIEGLISFGGRFGLGALLEIQKPLKAEGLSWFWGGGAYVGFEDDKTFLGPTGILGLDYKFKGIPLNLSLDWKPELDIIPEIRFVPDAFALSVRFAFN